VYPATTALLAEHQAGATPFKSPAAEAMLTTLICPDWPSASQTLVTVSTLPAPAHSLTSKDRSLAPAGPTLTPLPHHLSPSPAFPPPGHSIVVLGLVLGDLLVGQRHIEKLVGHPADVLVYD
jgi:hypothetical protein